MIALDMLDSNYYEHSAISQSQLKLLREEGGAAKLRYAPTDRDGTQSQKFGRLIHRAILQPTTLLKQYKPTQLDRTGTKAWLSEESCALGRELVKLSEFDQAIAIAEAVRRWSPIARLLLDAPDAMAEVSFFWTDPATGIQCKGRADLVVPSYRAIVDIKSTVDAAARPFARDCRRYGYDIQAVTYLDGWKLAGGEPIDNFVVIAVEKEPPYMAAAYEFSLDDLDAARDERARLMSIYDECRRSDSWPGYPGGLQTLTLQARTRTADE